MGKKFSPVHAPASFKTLPVEEVSQLSNLNDYKLNYFQAAVSIEPETKCTFKQKTVLAISAIISKTIPAKILSVFLSRIVNLRNFL